MYEARTFELGLAELWRQGLISGELHSGTGEEAIAAGVAAHMKKGDGIAQDRRCTPFLALLGGNLTLIIEFDVPAEGTEGEVPESMPPLPVGRARILRDSRIAAAVKKLTPERKE